MKKNPLYNNDFQKLAIEINKQLRANDGLIGSQQEQVELVMSLEKKFKHYILKFSQSTTIYEKFIYYIKHKRENILSAQPYFRESGKTFKRQIIPVIKKADVNALKKFNINHLLIDFIVKNWEGKLPDIPNRYYNEFNQARTILIENNLPLAINRAKLFFRKTPTGHLSLLDFIGICVTGLASGVDKYVGEYTHVWRSVCIGHMVGFMINEYSKTFLRLYPADRKILYRINSLKYKLKIEDHNTHEIAQAVTESFEEDKKAGRHIPKLPITEIQVSTLLNSMHSISYDSKSSDEGDSSGDSARGVTILDYTPSDVNIEENAINKNLIGLIQQNVDKLSLIERKIIKLKGVSL